MARKTNSAGAAIDRVWEKIGAGELGVLDGKMLSEGDLEILASRIKKTASFGTVFRLIDDLPKRGRAYDWNVGSILQHLDSELTVSSIQHVDNEDALYESVGLAWVLGKYPGQDPFIADYLSRVIRYAKNSDAWWQAAFSLEKIGVDDAVNLLKRSLRSSAVRGIDYLLDHLDDRRSVIGLLVACDDEAVRKTLYPRVRSELMSNRSLPVLSNCCWLIGRLRLVDDGVLKRLVSLLHHDNYDLRFNAFYAIRRNASERQLPILEAALSDSDPLMRKMATRGIASVGSFGSLPALEEALFVECDRSAVAEMSRAVYRIKNPSCRDRMLIERDSPKNENGAVIGGTARPYDIAAREALAAAEDPEGLCFDLIMRSVGKRRVTNPVCLNAGTGRMMRQVAEKVSYSGTLIGTDSDREMCGHAERSLRDGRGFTQAASVVCCPVSELPKRAGVKSSLIIAGPGFPGRGFGRRDCAAELKAVRDMLTDDGEFYTIGWDETLGDELCQMWLKYVSDDPGARESDDDCASCVGSFGTDCCCGLTWLKKGIVVPLQFGSLKESAQVMGHLFGRDAAQDVVRGNRTEWTMSLGITRDTKGSLGGLGVEVLRC